MRKHDQRQVHELLETLFEAHEEVKQQYYSQNHKVVFQLLSECQSFAISIGEFVEQRQGEGTKVVADLEHYCELLFWFSESNESTIRDHDLLQQLYEQLLVIKNGVDIELKPDRLEVLFIPYKASMWDSMESVWAEANADPQCNAIVMPIPYFDVLVGKGIGDVHYEGMLYPDYVPITDWQKYSIEDRRPDMIVIHNPYDDSNMVTSVHPNFYAKRLREYTDLLIYIPYFVVLDDAAPHHALTAGSLFADKVFLQSEKVRNTYIREFEKSSARLANSKAQQRAEDKYLAFGSPKFDKVIHSNGSNYVLPPEWRKMIEKPDGTAKKVVLYNTSIGTLLNGNEQVLHKLRDVFEQFKDRDDVVLLWRPHPLNTTTYKSMRPQLLEQYLEIVAQYKEKRIGIYDNTADLNRAISVSDAYYGDYSSLVPMYLMTGKPTMIQNLKVSKENNFLREMVFDSLCDTGEHLWFTALNFNGLFRIDKSSWNVEYISRFPGERLNGWRLYCDIIWHGNKLYFTPFGANGIMEYDPKSKQFFSFELAEAKVKTGNPFHHNQKFYSAIEFDNSIYFVGYSYPAIVRLDLSNRQLYYYSDWVEPLNGLITDPEGFYLKGARRVGSKIYSPAMSANAVVVFDMETHRSSVISVGRPNDKYSAISFDGSYFWLAPRHEGAIIRWNSSTNEFKVFDDYPASYFRGEDSFSSIEVAGEYVWLFPNLANVAVKVHLSDERIEVSDLFQKECERAQLNYPSSYLMSSIVDGTIFALGLRSNQLICVDPRTFSYHEQPLNFTEEVTSAIECERKYIFTDNGVQFNEPSDFIFYESGYLKLQQLLEHLFQAIDVNNDSLSEKQIAISRAAVKSPEGSAGRKIFSYCKHLILGAQES